jgi:uncharacterized protein YbcV (DUF1398 family)
MFDINQIKEAHSKVKSGADFPNYVQDLIKLGVTSYDTFVNDGHTKYFGENNFQVESESKYLQMEVAKDSDSEKFKGYLKTHQQGQTDYATFCKHSAETGVEKWTVDMKQMTCTYYDKANGKMLVENIPGL